jgi:hypothetical protein
MEVRLKMTVSNRKEYQCIHCFEKEGKKLYTMARCLDYENCKWWKGRNPKSVRDIHLHCVRCGGGALFPNELMGIF